MCPILVRFILFPYFQGIGVTTNYGKSFTVDDAVCIEWNMTLFGFRGWINGFISDRIKTDFMHPGNNDRQVRWRPNPHLQCMGI